MKQNHVLTVAALCGVMALGSCTKEVINDEAGSRVPTSRLSVMTRTTDNDTGGGTGDGTATLTYPVSLYIFDSGGDCRAIQAINEANTQASIPLTEGRYDIYAVAAEPGHFSLPAMAEAQPTSELALSGEALGDLLTGHANVTLVDGEENTLTLNLKRQVMQLKSVSISKVPSTISAVSVTISPLYEKMLLNGTLSGTAGSCTIPLTAGSDRSWTATDSPYLYPSVSEPTITVRFTSTDSTIKSYSYTCKEPMPANYRINIDGTYTEAVDVTLTGTLTGEDWSGTKSITFDFDESGSTKSDDGKGESGSGEQTYTNPYKVGDQYNGFYIVAVKNNTITILSNNEKYNIVEPADNQSQSAVSEKVNIALQAWNDNGITDEWRLPNAAEAGEMLTYLKSKGVNTKYKKYFYQKNESTISSCTHSTKYNFEENSTLTLDTNLRPVADITITE